jgi:hypothetical protein
MARLGECNVGFSFSFVLQLYFLRGGCVCFALSIWYLDVLNALIFFDTILNALTGGLWNIKTQAMPSNSKKPLFLCFLHGCGCTFYTVCSSAPRNIRFISVLLPRFYFYFYLVR